MSTIEPNAVERRSYKQDEYEYLLNDEGKTVWIVKGPRMLKDPPRIS